MSTERIGVVGAGMMGAEIALTFALAGHDTVLTDSSAQTRATATDRLAKILDRGTARGLFAAGAKEAALERLTVVESVDAYGDRDFVVEAVVEREEVKRAVFAELDRIVQPGAVFASNTSTIPISTLAAVTGTERRKRFLGTHFFSPVHRMKLVEVIPAFETEEPVVERVMGWCRAAGKEPIRVKDVAGFAVNRMLHAFMIEAVRLVEEGVCTPEDIDTACRLGLGHPVGPFELADLVTNHLCLEVQEILHAAYGPRFMPRPLLKQKVAAGHDGRNVGRGWHVHR
jgi:3-hydroxybutyryl-CoA dehydrogenase